MLTPLPPDFRPARRPGLAVARDNGTYVLFDQLRIGGPPIPLTRMELEAAQLFTGDHTLHDIQFRLTAKLGGLLVTTAALAELVARLDAALFLDGPAFRGYLAGPVRRPACIGCYPETPDAIHAQMRQLFVGHGGPGYPTIPDALPPGSRLRAVLVPHMDYARGGVTYGWGFKELAERTDARLFVIVATSHYSPERFTLTRMNFQTPLGTIQTDQGYIDRIAAHYGDGVFNDPFAHLPEHSIELEVVVLQHLFAGRRDFRIVPLLVGSFADCVSSGYDPLAAPDVRRMIEALRRAEADAGEPVCYVISGDLAHIGPKFDDPEPVAEPWLAESRRQDEKLLAELGRADPGGYFRVIAAEEDCRRICGLPPTFVTLAAARPTAGRVLYYGRYVHPAGFESVSFAAAAFYE